MESRQIVIQSSSMKIAVIIPCYKVRKHILDTVATIGSEVTAIYVVDDKCPNETGHYLEEALQPPHRQCSVWIPVTILDESPEIRISAARELKQHFRRPHVRAADAL